MKTLYTNYDTCSTMEDCKIACFYDAGFSQIEFEENFEAFEGIGRENHYWFYTDCGQCEKPECPSDCYDFEGVTEKEFRTETLKLGVINADDVIKEKIESENIWKEMFIESLDENSIAEYMRDGWPEIGKRLFKEVSITGHCQGDYAEVLYRSDLFNCDESVIRQEFKNYFYNAPAYLRLTVDGKEYYLEDALENCYEYDKDKVLAYVREELDLSSKVVDWLSETLPEYLEYV